MRRSELEEIVVREEVDAVMGGAFDSHYRCLRGAVVPEDLDTRVALHVTAGPRRKALADVHDLAKAAAASPAGPARHRGQTAFDYRGRRDNDGRVEPSQACEGAVHVGADGVGVGLPDADTLEPAQE